MIKVIYTDGANTPSKNHSGWAIVVMNGNVIEDIQRYYYSSTTNNQMELRGLLAALQHAEEHWNEEFIICCDSEYAVKSVTTWTQKWERNGWITTKGEPVKNIELMQELNRLYKKLTNVRIEHVDGHCGDGGNELADAVATNNRKKFKEIVEGYEYELGDDVSYWR